jgi:hypothetical protein
VSHSEPSAAQAAPISVLRSPRRLALAALGVLCVGLALAGIVVPGLPTTVFLIAASYLFTRSCPYLERTLVRHPVFAAYARYLDGSRAIPPRARWAAAGLMWTAVGTSLFVFHLREASAWLSALIVGAALAGSVCIARFRRARREPGFEI